MARKRTSLADIAVEEQSAETKVEIKSSESAKPSVNKLDQMKVSLTIDTETFKRLNELSLKRRIQKQPHGISELIRTAVTHWLQNEQI